MSTPGPFGITVYDRTRKRMGTVGAPQSISVAVRHNQQGTAELVVPATSPRIRDLLTPGARVGVAYRGAHLMTGPVTSYVGTGPRAVQTFTVQIADDWELLARMLAWPVPGSAITAQSGAEYDVHNGNAEAVFKALVAANLGHGNAGVHVAPSQGRGASLAAPLSNRFHPLTERTVPLVDAAGIGTTVRQVGDGPTSYLEVDCYATRDYPKTLTEASGVVQAWSYSAARPKATRVIVGGPGDGTARAFTSVVDTAAETTWGTSLEDFLDATDLAADADRTTRGRSFLADNAASAGLSVTLSDTRSFRYDPTGASGVRVGDRIRFDVGDVVITDVLRECVLSWSTDKGPTVTPRVGDRTDDRTRTLTSAIAALRVRLNNIRR